MDRCMYIIASGKYSMGIRVYSFLIGEEIDNIKIIFIICNIFVNN